MSTSLVALHLPPTDLPTALRRAWDDGAAVLPLPWEAPPADITRLVEQLRPARLIRRDGEDRHHAPGPALGLPEGSALVVPTSGSTGAPKAVVLSHAALQAATQASLTRLGAQQGERFALALPLHHVAGLQVVLRAWACATEPYLVDDPGDPTALAAAAAATEHVSLVPTQLARLLQREETRRAAAAWRTVLVGGAALDPDLAQAAAAAGVNVIVSYGMTETAGGCVYDGRPLDGTAVAIGVDRRIRLRGPTLCTGYLGSGAAGTGTPAADGSPAEPGSAVPTLRSPVDPDGWFATADLGAIRGGRLEVLGRSDDVAITGGENVSTEQVAAVLRRHAAVADAAVVGVPDREWGSRLVAVVAPRDPSDPPELAALRDLVIEDHSPAYAPRELVLVDELPRDPIGKLRRADLQALATRTPRWSTTDGLSC